MPAKLIRKSPWDAAVRQRLDASRPKYSNAVKSIAAFASTAQEFEVLVTHLEDACQEAQASAAYESRDE